MIALVDRQPLAAAHQKQQCGIFGDVHLGVISPFFQFLRAIQKQLARHCGAIDGAIINSGGELVEFLVPRVEDYEVAALI